MTTLKVNDYANSTLRGKRGRVVRISSGKSVWLRGFRHAKHVCLVFDHGDFAGREMWFSTGELDIDQMRSNT